MKRFISGLIWGGIVSTIGLVILSQNAPMPQPRVVAPDTTPDGTAPEGAETEAPVTEPAPLVPEPAPEAVAEAGAPEGGTETAEAPAAEAVAEAPAPKAPALEPAPEDAALEPAPEEAAEAPAPEAAALEPAPEEAAEAPAPAAAALEPAPEEAAEAPQTEEPEAVEAAEVEVPPGSEFARELPEENPTLPGIDAAPDTAEAPEVEAPGQAEAPAMDTAPAAAPAPEMLNPEAPEAPQDSGTTVALGEEAAVPEPQPAAPAPTAPEAEPAPAAAELPPPPPLTDEEKALAEAAQALVPEAEPAPETAQLPMDPVLKPVEPLPDSDGGEIALVDEPERPAAGFSGEVDGVVTGRLPQMGDAPETAGAGAEAMLDPSLLPPIERYARDFSNPEGKPLFAIILLDNGDPALDRVQLAALPFPVTFVLDPMLPDVERLAEPYVAGGQEVAMLATAIPQGATAADLEVTFGAHASSLPQAVAVVDLAEGGFQGNRPLATQVVPIVKGQGRGLLTYDAGLNAADQVARREALRSATIFRRIDPEGEPPEEIRRVLDRAAFRAAQDGQVAVVGTATPQTVAALLEWTVEGRAAAVALAPATAVMRAP